jgi:hypothetical protein
MSDGAVMSSWGIDVVRLLAWFAAVVCVSCFVGCVRRFLEVMLDDGWFFARRHLLGAFGCWYGVVLFSTIGAGWG